jgi:hypothetical protein
MKSNYYWEYYNSYLIYIYIYIHTRNFVHTVLLNLILYVDQIMWDYPVNFSVTNQRDATSSDNPISL